MLSRIAETFARLKAAGRTALMPYLMTGFPERDSALALANGVRLSFCVETVVALRARGVKAPIVMMGYFNPFLQYGLERFAADAATAGADGLIVPDLPPEEAAECQAACRAAGL